MKKTQSDVADVRELLQGSTKQFRLLNSGKGDVTIANAIATQVRSHISLMHLMLKMHGHGIKGGTLSLPETKK